MIRVSYLRFAWLPLLVLAGCGPARSSVEGTVTLAGQAVERGTVHLIPAADTGEAVQATIDNGRFRVSEMTPGTYMIRLSSPQKTGKKIKLADDAPGGSAGAEVDELLEAIPAEYNQNSTLQREIKPGRNVLEFSL